MPGLIILMSCLAFLSKVRIILACLDANVLLIRVTLAPVSRVKEKSGPFTNSKPFVIVYIVLCDKRILVSY